MKRKYILPEGIAINKEQPHLNYFETHEPQSQPSSRRDGTQVNYIEVDDDDVAVVEFEDGTIWYGEAVELPVYFSNDSDQLNRARRSGEALEYVIPNGITVENDTRGVFGFIKTKAISIFKKKATATVVNITLKQLASRLDSRLQPNPGLYKIDGSFKPIAKVDALQPSTEPYLIFLHGTATTFEGSFGGIAEGGGASDLYAHIIQNYSGRMYALQHKTITKTPMENVLDLARCLPAGSRVHLVSQSRGGMIGELLAAYSPGMNAGSVGFGKDELDALRKNYNDGNVVDSMHEVLAEKGIHVEKFIRVACPASGTRLCSYRLDRFFNVLLNGIAYLAPATALIAETVKEILEQILATKHDPEVLPGLEVMDPDSRFVKILNTPLLRIDAPLTVVQGKSKVGLNLRALVTLLSKLVFYRANDWIVDTVAMDEGIRRNHLIGVYLFESDEINHFLYFKTAATQGAILSAMKEIGTNVPHGFRAHAMPQYTESSERGFLTGSYKQVLPDYANTGALKREVVVVLPGILGSNLSIKEDSIEREIYLRLNALATGRLADLSIDKSGVVASSVIGIAYKALCKRLSRTYDVEAFPYDWRKSIGDEAELLADRLEEILTLNPNSIKLIAHSMGGLVLRHMIIKRPDTWKKLQARAGFRALFMGSPLGGSYLIPEILTGNGNRLKQLATLDFTNDRSELLQIFVKYPGLLQLLPLDAKEGDFGNAELWNELQERWKVRQWFVPDLAPYVAFRKEVKAFDDAVFFKDPNLIYVAGKAKTTLDGYYFDPYKSKRESLAFSTTASGDGSVTWASGIPKEFYEGARVYFIEEGHGKLCDSRRHFDGIMQLLERGSTDDKRFYRSGEGIQVASAYMKRDMLQEEHDPSTDWMWRVLNGGADDEPQQQDGNEAFGIRVVCGDMNYANHPIVLGHINEEVIMGAEKVMDRILDGALSRRLRLGSYVYEQGQVLLFPLAGRVKAIVTGLGNATSANSRVLSEAVASALREYALHRAQEEAPDDQVLRLSISTLLLGSDYIGLSIQQSIEATLSAIVNTNKKLRSEGIPAQYSSLEIVENHEHKACETYYVVRQLVRSGDYPIHFFQQDLIYKEGYLKKLPIERVRSWWMRMDILRAENAATNGAVVPIDYRFSEGLARVKAERRNLSLDTLEPIMEEMSKSDKWSTQQAVALYNLLIPYNFRVEFNQQQNIQLTLDSTTASFPWELMSRPDASSPPFATHGGMIRKLSNSNNRERVNHAKNHGVLVVGDPNLEGWSLFGQLPGAKAEAEKVCEIFTANGYNVTPHINSFAGEMNLNLHSRSYKVIHLAAHGVYSSKDVANSGLVIGNNRFLRAADLEMLNEVPELVFVNACHLGEMAPQEAIFAKERYKLAASFAEALIQIGVRSVVVAGWAVDDKAALSFAEVFYTSMFDGMSFSDAIIQARSTVHKQFSYTNTWGAYQAYGDENYRLQDGIYLSSGNELEDKYDLPANLKVELFNILQTKRTTANDKQVLARLKSIESALQHMTHDHTEIFELLACNFEQLRMDEDALKYFARARQTSDGMVTVRALELELKARRKHALRSKPLAEATADIQEAIKNMEFVLQIGQTRERLSLMAAMHKTLAYTQFNEKSSKASKAVLASLEKSIGIYKEAESKAHSSKERFYPYSNYLTLQYCLDTLSFKSYTKAKAKALLKPFEELFTEVKSTSLEMTSYWDRLLEANYHLLKYLYLSENDDLNEYLKIVTGAWQYENSRDKVEIELEHCDFLISMLRSNEGKMESLKKLRSELAKWLG